MLHAECIRHDYTSLAENAYPEAYSEFKHSMLLLVFEEELQTSPVKADWSLQTRTELAGMLCRTLRQIAGRSPLLLPSLSCQCQCHWDVLHGNEWQLLLHTLTHKGGKLTRIAAVQQLPNDISWYVVGLL